MAYGISTWDANGVYNNYGIKPVTVVTSIKLARGQNTGFYSFDIPAGFKVGFINSMDVGSVNIGRRIVASGNTITISPSSDIGVGNYPASECELVVFLERA